MLINAPGILSYLLFFLTPDVKRSESRGAEFLRQQNLWMKAALCTFWQNVMCMTAESLRFQI